MLPSIQEELLAFDKLHKKSKHLKNVNLCILILCCLLNSTKLLVETEIKEYYVFT